MTSRMLLALCLVLLGARANVEAQTPSGTIALFEAVEGTLDGGSESFTFTGRTGEPLSFRVEATSGDLDPVLTLRDLSGRTVISNDDYDYPENQDSLLQAVTIPEFGTYTAVVSAFGGTSGDFTLTMLPGYALEWPHDNATELDGWTVNEDPIEASDDGLAFAPADDATLAVALNDEATPPADFFAQARVLSLTGNDWTAGIAARAQSAQEYYLFLVNGRGEWRFTVQTPDGETVIRDWNRHPSIRADLPGFTIGLLAAGSGFDLFFNGNILGHVSDSTYREPGALGVALGRTRPLAPVTGRFDDLRATLPDRSDNGPLLTQPLLLGTANATVVELQRRLLIPGTGQLVLNVPESFSQYTRPGITLLGLASGLTFADFAMGATVYNNSVTGALGGCGLVLRQTEPTRYLLAYMDGQGGFGLAERDGENFLPGIYTEGVAWNRANGTHLLVVAVGSELHYYVNGAYVGSLETALTSGSVGNAVVNFEAADTSCRFQNTWLWRSDEPARPS